MLKDNTITQIKQMNTRFEYATLEWLWDSGNIRVNLPHNVENKTSGTYPEVVNMLGTLGQDRWEVATCTSGGNWLFWTLKREVF